MKKKALEYHWFQQTSFAYFCPNQHLTYDEIENFEHTFQLKYSPQGPCLSIVNKELKMELILISISLGFSLLLMLLTWLLIWQDRFLYSDLLRDRLQKRKKESIKSVIESAVISYMNKSNQIETMKPAEVKRMYKGYLPADENVK